MKLIIYSFFLPAFINGLIWCHPSLVWNRRSTCMWAKHRNCATPITVRLASAECFFWCRGDDHERQTTKTQRRGKASG